jgi:hypothetical protein
MNRRQNQLLILGTKIEVIVFFGVALSLYIVLFKSTLSNAKMQRNWLDSDSKLLGMDSGALVVCALQPC